MESAFVVPSFTDLKVEAWYACNSIQFGGKEEGEKMEEGRRGKEREGEEGEEREGDGEEEKEKEEEQKGERERGRGKVRGG